MASLLLAEFLVVAESKWLVLWLVSASFDKASKASSSLPMILKLGKEVIHVPFAIQSVFGICQSLDFVTSYSDSSLHADY